MHSLVGVANLDNDVVGIASDWTDDEEGRGLLADTCDDKVIVGVAACGGRNHLTSWDGTEMGVARRDGEGVDNVSV